MSFKKQLCARILSEANDLKRTIPAMAHDLKMDVAQLQEILNGESELREVYQLIDKMGDHYAIDKADLLLPEDDCQHGVRIMRAKASEQSARTTQRLNRFGEKTDYYEYRDTAMSRLAPFKPEWIRQLRNVLDADPYNPDVIYNNGHLMHQTTFFIGPVNFYWEVNGQRHCQEMNTGDSNYITPYWKHSFTNRDPSQTALILAITFGGQVRYAQKEFYALKGKAKNYKLDFRNVTRAQSQLIRQLMDNESLTIENLNEQLSALAPNLKAIDFLDEEREKNNADLEVLARVLNVSLADLLFPAYHLNEEVVVQQCNPAKAYYYPDEQAPHYRIQRLARTAKMPQMKGFNMEVLSALRNMNNAFSSSLHSYVFNYGKSPCHLIWQDQDKQYNEIIYPGDSIYLQPFVQHAFRKVEATAQLYIVRVPGHINLATQKELSYFSDMERVIEENTCWFN